MNFKKAYNTYKKLPFIYAIFLLVAAIAWGIVDYCEYITDISYLDFGGLAIWFAIGLVSSAIVFFVTTLCISPTVLRTDAVLKIAEKFEKDE